MVACPSTPAQVAALRGFSSAAPYVREMVKEFQIRRDIIIRALRAVPGMRCVNPKGAFYAFPTFDWDMTDSEAANELLKRGLLCTPGSSFGTLGERHLRFSFATSRRNIEKAVNILSAFGEEQS
jgi:aspartate aminotransferase